jgi:hypothetical protein
MHPEELRAMGHMRGAGPRHAGRRWRAGRVAAIAIGLLLVERVLVGQVGPPMVLARMLLDLGDPWAGPIMSLLALMALAPRRWPVMSCSSWRWIAGHAARADRPAGPAGHAPDDPGRGPPPGRPARRWRAGRPGRRGRAEPVAWAWMAWFPPGGGFADGVRPVRRAQDFR